MNPKSIFIFSVVSVLLCGVFLHVVLSEEPLTVYTEAELDDMTNAAVAALTPEQRVNISERKAQEVFEYVHHNYRYALNDKDDVVHDLAHLVGTKLDIDRNIDTALQGLTKNTATALGTALSILLVSPPPALVTALETGSVNSIREALTLVDADDVKTAAAQLLYDTESRLLEMTYEGYTNTELGATYLPLTTLAEHNNQFLSEWEVKVKARDPDATTTLADGSVVYTPVSAPSYRRNYDPPITSLETASAVKLDPETQVRVDALLEEAETLSAEAEMWSNKLYAESQEILRKLEENEVDIVKKVKMRRDPYVDKDTYDAFAKTVDARWQSLNNEGIRIQKLYRENKERRYEAMHLRSEARRLHGLK